MKVGLTSARIPYVPGPIAPPVETRTLRPAPDTVELAEKLAMVAPRVDSGSLPAAGRQALLQELSSFPSQVWRVLGESGLKVVSVSADRPLWKSSALANFSITQPESELRSGRALLLQLLADSDAENAAAWANPGEAELQKAMWDRYGGAELAERLTQLPALKDLGFRAAVLQGAVSTEALLSKVDMAPGADAERWLQQLRDLNGPAVQEQGGRWSAPQHVLLLPHPSVDGQSVRADHLAYLKSQDDRQLLAGMGTNYWQSAVVAVHQQFLPDPAPEAGHHRVALHEVGHALDHALERIGTDGLGQHHRQTVDALFAADRAAGRFSSTRAADNVREYFAEAVESYLTNDRADAFEPKPDNHHAWLQNHSPELFNYVDDVFRRSYPADLQMAPLPEHPRYEPPRSLLAHHEKAYLELG